MNLGAIRELANPKYARSVERASFGDELMIHHRTTPERSHIHGTLPRASPPLPPPNSALLPPSNPQTHPTYCQRSQSKRWGLQQCCTCKHAFIQHQSWGQQLSTTFRIGLQDSLSSLSNLTVRKREQNASTPREKCSKLSFSLHIKKQCLKARSSCCVSMKQECLLFEE